MDATRVARKHGPAARQIFVRQAGERQRQVCTWNNEQVAAGILPQENKLSDGEIELAVRHAQERSGMEIDKNNDECDLREKYAKLHAELDARQKSEVAALQSQQE